MRTLVTGHRLHKLQVYDIEWIKIAISDALTYTFLNSTSLGLSGMASGVDLWFCEELLSLHIPYHAYIPFEEQDETMDFLSKQERIRLIQNASKTINARNSIMVEKCDA